MRERQRLDPARHGFGIALHIARAGFRLFDNRFRQREDILDAVVQLFIHQLPANLGPLLLFSCRFRVPQHNVAQIVLHRVCNRAVALGPWRRLAAHFLTPQIEALARCQAIAKRTNLLHRLPTPVDEPAFFRSEEQQVIAWGVRNRNRQHARDRFNVVSSFRDELAELVGRPDFALRRRIQQLRQRLDHRFRRHGAGRDPRPVDPQCGAIAGDQMRNVSNARA